MKHVSFQKRGCPLHATTTAYCRPSILPKAINTVGWNLKKQRTSERDQRGVKISVAFDSKSREMEADDLNLITNYKLRREKQFQNPGKRKHFPFLSAPCS